MLAVLQRLFSPDMQESIFEKGKECDTATRDALRGLPISALHPCWLLCHRTHVCGQFFDSEEASLSQVADDHLRQ